MTPANKTALCALLLIASATCGAKASAQAENHPEAKSAPGPADDHASPSAAKKTKVYKYKLGGTTAFSDIPPSTGHYVVWSPSCFACDVGSAMDWQSTRLHLEKFSLLIESASQKYAVDPALVRAVIHAESGFNPAAKSHKGAIGLMQLMPATARTLGVADAAAPSSNIQGGVRYLATLLERFKGDIGLAAAAYNAGPEAVAKYAGIPPYAETRVYVQRVKILHQRYQLGS